MNIKTEINELKENSDSVFNRVIGFLTIILFVYCYFGSFSFHEKMFNDIAISRVTDYAYYKIIYHNTSAFVLFFVIGLIYTKLIVKTSPKEFGLKVGNHKLGLILCGIATIIMPLLALTCVTDPDMSSTYPLVDFKVYSQWYYIAGYFASYLLYYIGWEYLFRGMAFFGSERKLGPLGAIWLTTMISALIHTSVGGFGKPVMETLSAIPAGLIFGWVAYKTRSIYYTLYMHVLIGFATDIFIHLLA